MSTSILQYRYIDSLTAGCQYLFAVGECCFDYGTCRGLRVKSLLVSVVCITLLIGCDSHRYGLARITEEEVVGKYVNGYGSSYVLLDNHEVRLKRPDGSEVVGIWKFVAAPEFSAVDLKVCKYYSTAPGECRTGVGIYRKLFYYYDNKLVLGADRDATRSFRESSDALRAPSKTSD